MKFDLQIFLVPVIITFVARVTGGVSVRHPQLVDF